jgi:hypothetical protein
MQYLADMGADMIKIEPTQGAYERHWAGANRAKVNGVSAFYLSANRNSRSIAMDLKKPDAKEIVHRLIEKRLHASPDMRRLVPARDDHRYRRHQTGGRESSQHHHQHSGTAGGH